MSIRAGIKREYTRNFNLDETRLRKIADVVREHGAKLSPSAFVEFTVHHEDNAFYVTKDVEEVIADDNIPGKAIDVLAIRLRNPDAAEDLTRRGDFDSGIAARIEFTSSSRPPQHQTSGQPTFRSPRIDFEIAETQRDWCLLLADDLDSQVTRFLGGRTLSFVRCGFADALLGMSIVLIAFYMLLRSISSLPAASGLSAEVIARLSVQQGVARLLQIQADSHRIVSNMNSVIPLMCIVVLGMLLATFLQPIARLISATNRSVFDWGDMMAAHKRFSRSMSQVKWGVGVAFIVSAGAGILVWFLTKSH